MPSEPIPAVSAPACPEACSRRAGYRVLPAHASAWRPPARLCLSAALALLVAACGGGSAVTPPTDRPPSVERNVLPAAADARVSVSLEPHVAINPSPSLAPANKLFVFLPGTSGLPGMYRRVLRTGAERGVHSIGLNYPNPVSVGSLCDGSAQADCHWDVRREVIFGVDSSPLVDIAAPDAVVTRLTQLLVHMNQSFPAEGWGQFLSAGAVDWSKVTVSGHSQGGGHAGVMAKNLALDRVVYFASPADWSTTADAPAPWTSRPNLTAASRQFGLTHVSDPLVPVTRLAAIWRNLGLEAFGPAVQAELSSAPYAGTHMLSTRLTPDTSGLSASPFHGAPVLDDATPKAADGSAVLAPAWIYLAFP